MTEKHEEVLRAIATTAEVTGAHLSREVLQAMHEDLSEYPAEAVLTAFKRVRREVRGRFSLADVIARVQATDGRPDADEAWAGALPAQDERVTIVWTDDACQAFAVAKPLLDAGDKVAARMAFKSAYERITREARERGEPVRWFASLGHDPEERRAVVQPAEEQGKLTAGTARKLLGPPQPTASVGMQKLLDGPPGERPAKRASAREHLSALRKMITGKGRKRDTTQTGRPESPDAA
jgi:hypothetical protein